MAIFAPFYHSGPSLALFGGQSPIYRERSPDEYVDSAPFLDTKAPWLLLASSLLFFFCLQIGVLITTVTKISTRILNVEISTKHLQMAPHEQQCKSNETIRKVFAQLKSAHCYVVTLDGAGLCPLSLLDNGLPLNSCVPPIIIIIAQFFERVDTKFANRHFQLCTLPSHAQAQQPSWHIDASSGSLAWLYASNICQHLIGISQACAHNWNRILERILNPFWSCSQKLVRNICIIPETSISWAGMGDMRMKLMSGVVCVAFNPQNFVPLIGCQLVVNVPLKASNTSSPPIS